MLTVGDFKTKVTGKLRGTSLAKVSDVYGKFREAAVNMQSRIDINNTIRKYSIQNAIHEKVYNYTAPTDLKGIQKVIDLRPVSPRAFYDEQNMTHSKDFDIRKQYNSCAVEVVDGVKTLRISKKIFGNVSVCPLDQLTGPATITGNGDVSNIDINYQNYVGGNGSVSFDIGGAGQAILYIALSNSIDLSKLKDVGSLFHWLNIPNASALTNVKLRYGADSSNYWTVTVTSPHDRTSFESGAWLLNRYNWSGAVQTGSPDESTISYLEIELNYTGGAQAGVLVNSITASLGRSYELVYYSEYLFKGVDGTWKSTPTADTDIVMVDTEAENIYLYELCKIFGFEVKGKNFASDYKWYNGELEDNGNKQGLYSLYTENNPSQAIQAYTTYANVDDLSEDTVGSYDDEQDFALNYN